MNLFTSDSKKLEVEYITGKIKKLDQGGLKILRKEAKKNKRKRKRYCLHDDINDPVHEMFIVHSKNTYIRPHSHPKKSESLFIIDGKIKYIVFDNKGNIKDIFFMSSHKEKRNIFYNRINRNIYHSIFVLSDTVTFMEITNGPFSKESTKFAKWSPDEKLTIEGLSFLKSKIKDYNVK